MALETNYTYTGYPLVQWLIGFLFCTASKEISKYKLITQETGSSLYSDLYLIFIAPL
jgi:hypothetical protein